MKAPKIIGLAVLALVGGSTIAQEASCPARADPFVTKAAVEPDVSGIEFPCPPSTEMVATIYGKCLENTSVLQFGQEDGEMVPLPFDILDLAPGPGGTVLKVCLPPDSSPGTYRLDVLRSAPNGRQRLADTWILLIP